jgi:hypothetical protein
MKKRTLIIAIVALLVLTAMPLVAQNNGQTLNIGGIVPLQLTLTVDTTAYNHQNLPLETDVVDHTETIADITVTTNNSAGWELHAFSDNLSNLVNATTDTIAYDIGVTDGVVATVFAPISTADGILLWEENLGDTGVLLFNGTIELQYDRSATYPAGYYSDQLALVLRAK